MHNKSKIASSLQKKKNKETNNTGADLGGGGGGGGVTPPLPQGFDPCRPKGSSLWYFWPTDPKIYTNFEGERAPKKNAFFVKIFQKVPENGFI